jgi:hypothetical protein
MRRTLVAVALTSSLFTATSNPSNLLEQIGSLLGSLWSAPANSKEGCGMDPSGWCSPEPQAQSKEGCGWDPNGLQSPESQPQAPEGCGLDPYGRCSHDPQP